MSHYSPLFGEKCPSYQSIKVLPWSFSASTRSFSLLQTMFHHRPWTYKSPKQSTDGRSYTNGWHAYMYIMYNNLLSITVLKLLHQFGFWPFDRAHLSLHLTARVSRDGLHANVVLGFHDNWLHFFHFVIGVQYQGVSEDRQNTTLLYINHTS